MKNVTDSFISLSSAEGFGLNTNILETNIINLSVVLGVLIYFGKGVLSNLLDNRKQKISSTIQSSEELCKGAANQLEQARARLREVERRVREIRVNGYSQIQQEKNDLINVASINLKQLENLKNETIHLEQERVIELVQKQISYQAVQRALGTLNSRLNSELHLRTIEHNIDLLLAMKNITD
ncbi:ATP synthase CF0 subunit I (chloroplast) [Cryptomeria japonica]|uniref:ATP synthase subunit b, chloroplastic n=4 Tax=Cryptomeria japonica TaxID=3369 RepID=ATPF_CRYJA|nr:ATP synthase CF0 subunit I [Cryptomeria japonica]B1VKH9.1 RecName: Full=ATP synthase subunit b, chloroplastic; AltName: Full=ATP synthase F(0) sector subunit b; AltName: Full=ATPase subunit I [Cryptomeria japonica]UFA48265.1 ATP synthase CF0 subunit I [Cryptomeria japonica var. sinensis]UFA48347.1 ATP synthase CF0 subunit I [Cryptomeria japonica var. sinensis]UFA48429.1 ATP synthase CF0 subunit I [Cryptomeria japonica var. sinensis]UFA48513.1 ATP synthase CF0 subunit I [Cryptomeria japonica